MHVIFQAVALVEFMKRVSCLLAVEKVLAVHWYFTVSQFVFD